MRPPASKRLALVAMAALALAVLAIAGGCGEDDEPADGGSPAGADEGAAAAGSAIPVERLRGGGHAVVFRHAATDSGIDTTNDLSDCSKQRNLDAGGRRQSREIGRAFERLEIPVGRVLASPFCRTRDTAQIAFGRVRPSRRLLSVEFFASPAAGRRKGLRRVLRSEPRAGRNTVLVTHGSAILDATGEDVEEGEAVVVEPGRGERGYAVVATVPPGAWRSARPD